MTRKDRHVLISIIIVIGVVGLLTRFALLPLLRGGSGTANVLVGITVIIVMPFLLFLGCKLLSRHKHENKHEDAHSSNRPQD